MLRFGSLAFVAVLLSLTSVDTGHAQDWRPPSRDMPPMPQLAELTPSWMSARSDWFGGAATLSGIAASDLSVAGEPRPGSHQAQVVRVSNGPLPVVVWQDRNGDSRVDLIEIFRNGAVVLQVIDAEYDGQANVLRRYNDSGALLQEDRI